MTDERSTSEAGVATSAVAVPVSVLHAFRAFVFGETALVVIMQQWRVAAGNVLPEEAGPSLLPKLIVALAIFGVLGIQMRKGRAWARRGVILVAFMFTLYSVLDVFMHVSQDPLEYPGNVSGMFVLIRFAIAAVNAFVLYLMFRADTVAYFREQPKVPL